MELATCFSAYRFAAVFSTCGYLALFLDKSGFSQFLTSACHYARWISGKSKTFYGDLWREAGHAVPLRVASFQRALLF